MQIRHVTQLNNRLANECGQACCTMLANAYNGTSLTVEEVARATGTDKGRFTPFYAYVDNTGARVPGLYDMLNHYGIKAKHTGAASFEWHLAKWAAGVPVVTLIGHPDYGNIGHFIVTVSAKGGLVTLFDPLSLTGPVNWPEAKFKHAISIRSVFTGGTNNPTQAMYPLTPLAAPVPPLAARVYAVGERVYDAAEALEVVA